MTLVLYGPTVTGKTNLAISLARKFQGELISADSRQVYQGLDIGTGKVSFNSKVEKHLKYWIVDGITIRGFDLNKPNTQFTVADFLKFATQTTSNIQENNKLPIIVGGTGFYIKAFINGLGTFGVPADKKLRSKLEKLSINELQEKLNDMNPIKINNMNRSDMSNPRRLIRAIEIASYKTAASSFKVPKTHRNLLIIGLTAPNEYLFTRSDKWLEERLDNGLIAEVSSLLDKGVSSKWLENLGLEYRWITRLVKGQVQISEVTKRIKGDSHALIRRQKTFFNQFENILLYDVSRKKSAIQIEKTVRTWYNR